MQVDKHYTIYPAGDYALTVSFGNEMDPVVNQYVLALRNALALEESLWLDIIPSYGTLTVVYDPMAIRRLKAPSAHAWAKEKLMEAMKALNTTAEVKTRALRIPVCYDTSFAPDLKRLASAKGISVEEVIELHFQRTYRVYMLGFLPGFAYMGRVNDRIVMPRLDKPRARVHAGSVGIAGSQTGIYPLESPGGWNLIGRTPVKLFDAGLSDPVFFKPGDEVTFNPISLEELESFDPQLFELQAK